MSTALKVAGIAGIGGAGIGLGALAGKADIAGVYHPIKAMKIYGNPMGMLFSGSVTGTIVGSAAAAKVLGLSSTAPNAPALVGVAILTGLTVGLGGGLAAALVDPS